METEQRDREQFAAGIEEGAESIREAIRQGWMDADLLRDVARAFERTAKSPRERGIALAAWLIAADLGEDEEGL